MKRNIRLLLAYDGTDFNGWQIQSGVPTIQGEIEKHLRTMNNCHVPLHGAGRTDAGVHALGMVAHFFTATAISCRAFANGLNAMLPQSIRILDATEEEHTFHARFSAKGKTYRYTIFNGKIHLPLDRFSSLHIKAKLDFADMEKCLGMIIGTHDFGCFETAGSRDTTLTGGRGSIRTISNAELMGRTDDFYDILITGDGFLRHMVRNIVGTVIEVGLQRRTVENFGATISSRNRSKGGGTAPAHGLTLLKIFY